MVEIEQMIGGKFSTTSKEPCWALCRKVLGLLGRDVPARLSGMAMIEKPEIGSVVLFRQKKGFHAGVVWPDCLHFIHCREPLNQPGCPPDVRVDRLSDPLYEPIIDGFYQ